MTLSPPAATRPKRKINLQAVGIYVAAIVLFAVLGFMNSNFLTVNNLRDVAVSASVNAIIGIGLTFVIITAGIDLSVGAIASFVGIVSANLMVNNGVPAGLGLLLGIALGILCGIVNGLLVTKLRLPPFIATLGTMSVFQGCAYVATNGRPVYNIPQDFVLILNSYVVGVPVVVIVVAAVAIAAWLLLRKTVFGQNVIAVGGSEETAWLSGVRVHRGDILNWHPDPVYTHRTRGDIMTDPVWRSNFALMEGLGLSFDLQVFPSQLVQAAELASDFPGVRIILDHAGMPIGRDAESMSQWRAGLLAVARNDNVSVKVSALGTNDHRWTTESIRPIVRETIEIFGPHRTMFGSNFPVDSLYSSFARLYEAFDEITGDLPAPARTALFSGTATSVYRLEAARGALLSWAAP